MKTSVQYHQLITSLRAFHKAFKAPKIFDESRLESLDFGHQILFVLCRDVLHNKFDLC